MLLQFKVHCLKDITWTVQEAMYFTYICPTMGNSSNFIQRTGDNIRKFSCLRAYYTVNNFIEGFYLVENNLLIELC